MHAPDLVAQVAPPGVPYMIRVPGSPSVASPSRLSEAVSARGRQQRLNRSTSDLGMLGHTLVYESRADHHGSLERRLNGHRHAPSLSLYKRENTEMEALAHVLRDASRTRAECGHAMSLDGDATQRSRKIAARLQQMLRQLESVSVATVRAAKLGAEEREATIKALIQEVELEEEDVLRGKKDHYELIHAERAMHHGELTAIIKMMQSELRNSESITDQLDAMRIQHEADELWKAGEGERARLAAEKAKEEQLIHLQRIALHKLGSVPLLRGWNTWLELYQRSKHLRMRAAAAFRNRKFYAAMMRWKEVCPSQTLLSRCTQLEGMVADQDATITSLKARLKAAEREIRTVEDAEEIKKESQVMHLQGYVARRMLRYNLARGMTTWIDLYHANQELKKRALVRFVHQGLSAALNRWKAVYPPRLLEQKITGPLLQKIHDLEQQLKLQMAQHEKLRKTSAKLFAEKESVRAMAKHMALLTSLVEHQQRCLAEALEATSWTTCRQVLYHESLRYVQTAATHGKQLKFTRRRQLFRRSSSGVLVDADDLEVMKRRAIGHAHRAHREEPLDAEVAAYFREQQQWSDEGRDDSYSPTAHGGLRSQGHDSASEYEDHLASHLYRPPSEMSAAISTSTATTPAETPSSHHGRGVGNNWPQRPAPLFPVSPR